MAFNFMSGSKRHRQDGIQALLVENLTLLDEPGYMDWF